MKSKLILFAIAFLLQSGILCAQTFTECYWRESSEDFAIVTVSIGNPASFGQVFFTVDKQKYSISNQAYPYITGGIFVDNKKMQEAISRGILDPSYYMKSEPVKHLHTDIEANGYKVRQFGSDSPRNKQLDITIPSGKTLTYHYNQELTNMAIANQQAANQNSSTPSQSFGSGSTNSPTQSGGGANINVASMVSHYQNLEKAMEMALDNYRNAKYRGASKSEIDNLRGNVINHQQRLRQYRQECNSRGANINPGYYETMVP